MASLVNLHEAEVIGCAQTSSSIICSRQSVRLIFSFVEVLLVWPLHSQGPMLVSEPIANVVHISGIDQDANSTAQHVRKHCLKVMHPITLKGCINNIIAGAPPLGHTQL